MRNEEFLGARRGPSEKYKEIVEWLNAGPDVGSTFVYGAYDDKKESSDARHSLYMALRAHTKMTLDKDWTLRRRVVREGRRERFEVIVIVTNRLTDGFLKQTVR